MTKFICEIGSNHNSSLSRCYDMIDTAKEIGCWAVKFQLFKANKLYAPEFKNKIEQMKKWELPETYIKHIVRYCKKKEIKFICTPFDLEAVKFLTPYVDLFKIGSYELLNYDLITTVAKTNKPWILSVGMGTISDIYYAAGYAYGVGNLPYGILMCNSCYPAMPNTCNLHTELIKLKQTAIGPDKIATVKYGWSDHTVEPGVIYKAIALGTEIIEFHMDLNDKLGFEYPIGHCWLPLQIKEVIRNVRIGEEACFPIKDNKDNENRKWRMDPEDGMRPLKQYREELLNG